MPRLLDHINSPIDLRKLQSAQLKQVAKELREETIQTVSQTGGHLGAGLGVIELTIALHYVFNTPEDLLVWDVGHQTYPHKILTGRKDKIHTIRQPGGLSGFTKRSESVYDTFGAGHSSTSISSALGMAIARDEKQEQYEVVSVIGDGGLSAGMAYEALNHLGARNTRMIVILNDNEMSISPAVGAMSSYLCRIVSDASYLKIKELGKKFTQSLPDSLNSIIKKSEQYVRSITGNNFFEDMGFRYFGPIDGHDIGNLVAILQNIKSSPINTPILLHVKTTKGKGFDSPENSSEQFHAVKKFDIASRVQQSNANQLPTYSAVFGSTLAKIADSDPEIIAITAAMKSGTGLKKLAADYPDKVIDVGIAEQHAVTLAGGIATRGMKPFVAIYSTFLQRAYDQVIHDIAIQNLPVRFIIDRAGIVGADGSTHAGSFDIAYLSNIPHFIVMAPSNGTELINMIHTAHTINSQPCAIRFPRGNISRDVDINAAPITLEIGKSRVIQGGAKIALISLGTRLEETLKAAAEIQKLHSIKPTVVDARFAKPLDTTLITEIANNHSSMITIEEGAIGGIGSHVMHYLSREGLLEKVHFRSLCLPDQFLEHGIIHNIYEEVGLNASGIIRAAEQLLA